MLQIKMRVDLENKLIAGIGVSRCSCRRRNKYRTTHTPGAVINCSVLAAAVGLRAPPSKMNECYSSG